MAVKSKQATILVMNKTIDDGLSVVVAQEHSKYKNRSKCYLKLLKIESKHSKQKKSL